MNDFTRGGAEAADEAGVTVRVDLAALRRNYRLLADAAAPARCGAAVKGDAYGTGIARTAPALHAEGCRDFFVALPMEARELRRHLPDGRIYVLNGLAPECARFYTEIDAVPVLASLEEIEEWAALARELGRRLPAALHVETGINRLALSATDVDRLASRQDLLDAFDWHFAMSHLSHADLPDDLENERQPDRLEALRRLLPAMPASLANSAATLGDPCRHFDIVRPGIALYGGNPFTGRSHPMEPVVTVTAKVLQVRDVAAGAGVGYGALWRAPRPARIAVVSIGYADGFFRMLSTSNAHGKAGVSVGGEFAPLAGRVSMDMITVDVTHIAAENVMRGTNVEIIGRQILVDDFADWAGTISYEVLSRLGSRGKRVYTSGDVE